ncbi:unnamed protein product [Ilex paraguariensis]|uniref:Tyrosine-protein phosphatase domain-containing protein n=1 Tax=Ilex paraguariensis TaxID=185542 RepID=A0ABC8R6D0_9AQUA
MYEDPLLRAFIAEIMTNCKSLGECLRLIGVAYDPLEMLAQGLSRPMTIYGRAAGRMKAVDMRNRCSVALDSVNYCKNRYTDVIPFDKNRVVLNPCKDYRSSARGYINASFITTSESVSQFIATQGPLPHTFEDFWEMIIQNRCPVIVMLTRLIDNYKVLNCIEFKVIFVVFSDVHNFCGFHHKNQQYLYFITSSFLRFDKKTYFTKCYHKTQWQFS